MGKKNRKPGGSKKPKNDDDEVEEDERFAAAHNRPQFRVNQKTKSKGGASSSKIVLDERFSSVLTDPRFQMQEKDKYGRKDKRKKSSSNKQGNSELDAFYTVVDENENEEKGKQSAKKEDDDDNASTASSSSSSSSGGSKENDEDPASRISYLTALSRGELDVSSGSSDEDEGDSSDSSDDDSSVEGEDPVHGTAGVLDPSFKEQEEEEVQITYDDSPYLAVTSLDWQHVKAMDIFAILSSFAPPGSVKRVQVFLSDFGKEKMAHELQHGPPSLWKKKKKKKDKKKEQSTGIEDDDGSEDDSHGSDSGSENEEEDDVDYEGMDEQAYADFLQNVKEQQMPTDSDFDPEKLRAYEASKLKYYFAVAEFENAASADAAYREVDGMEFEHSSAAVDMRSIPVEAIESVTENREMRDEATGLPGNYDPPEFIVGALQQTNVTCTWEAGDAERERMLTKYGSAEQWASMAEKDDLKAYLASDSSDDDDDDSDNDSDAPNAKGAKLRKLLGLDADSDEDAAGGKEASSDDEEDEGDKEVSKEIRYVPGKADLQEKIRTKLQTKNKEEKAEELTPWEKYQQKRKEKRKERRQAARSKRSDIQGESKPKRQSDKFFMEENNSDSEDEEDNVPHKPSKAELELLLAGDNDEEVAKDFDMRGLHRIQKNKDKKLSKSRKRKEEKRAAGVSGQEFAIDLKDSRFAKVMDGDDDRFGINKMDPQYKETPAMKEILDEQRVRRKKKRKKNPTTNTASVAPNVVEGSGVKSAGAAALSSLVKSLKTKVQ